MRYIEVDGKFIDLDKQWDDIIRTECEDSLYEFLRTMWRPISSAPFTEGWPIEAVAEHLQAVVDGDIKRLIINIPPRCSKSSLCSVAFPAWTWAQPFNSPTSGPGVQFLFASHGRDLALRDSTACRRVIEDPLYQRLWGDRYSLMGDQNTKTRFDTDKGGSRLSTSVGSSLTGEGGNIIVVDDPNNAQDANSEAKIQETIEWWDGALSTRLNDPKSGAFVIVQQRLSEQDVTGYVLEKDIGDWTHLCLPMRYEWNRHSYTSIGWQDPRGLDEDGEPLVLVGDDGSRYARDFEAALELEKREGALLWPERFGEREVALLERQMGPWTAAGQLQQRPEPKGGGIIKRDWWQLWERDILPGADYIIAALDTAYTTKQENDMSAMTVWGVFSGGDGTAQVTRQISNDKDGESLVELSRTYTEEHPKVILLYAWQDRLELHDLVQRVQTTMKQFKVDKLLIENKAAGHSVAQELRRLFNIEDFSVQLVDPKGQDKVARLYSIQHLFAEGLIYAPDRAWAEQVITQCSAFPKAKHDDLVDTVSMGLRHLRELGLLVRGEEYTAELDDKMQFSGAPPQPLYAV
jgi:predicted phage terminase large subunit-like protein